MCCLCRFACKTCKATQGARVLQVRRHIKRRISTLVFFSFSLSPSDGDVKRRRKRPATGSKHLFIRKPLPPSSGSSCLRHFQELHGLPPCLFPLSNSNPKEKYPQFHPGRRGVGGGGLEDYCFPICCPEQTRPYQSKPAQLLFHMALMYWKAFHSRLPLAAAAEQA